MLRHVIAKSGGGNARGSLEETYEHQIEIDNGEYISVNS